MCILFVEISLIKIVFTTSVFIIIFQWLYQKISQTRPFKDCWTPAPSAPSNPMMKEALSSDDDNENSDEAGPSRQNEESSKVDNEEDHSEYEQFPEGYSAPFKVVKPLTPEALAVYKAAQDRAGIIYISRIPPGMQPAKVRHLMSAYGEVGRVYLQQEGVSFRNITCNTCFAETQKQTLSVPTFGGNIHQQRSLISLKAGWSLRI